jgi:cytochrome c553
MTAIAKDMSDADLRGFSDFIGQLPPAAGVQAQGPVDAQRMAQAQALAKQHQCVVCHGADFSGDKQVPRVGGQREDYLTRALREYKAGTRVGYTPAMNEAVTGVSQAELDTLAWYLARQGPGAPGR